MTNQAEKPAKTNEFWWYITWYLTLDERRNLFPDDLQWFGMKILTQKIVLFGFLEVEGKKNSAVNMDCWVLYKNSNQRELTYVTWLSRMWLNSRKDIFVFSVGSEQFMLGKEHNSSFFRLSQKIMGQNKHPTIIFKGIRQANSKGKIE
jgi:hypothetical protein